MTPSGSQTALNELPSLPRAYLRALFSRKPSVSRSVPVIKATLANLRFEPEQLSRYCALFGTQPSAELPVLYPQVVTASAFAELVLRPEFPFRPRGLIHRRTTVTALEPLSADVSCDAAFRIQASRDTEQGTELEFVTELAVRGRVAWHGSMIVLVPQQGERKERREAHPPPPSLDVPGIRVARWRVASDIGRRYARVSGDYNPIHLSLLSARLFGYRRAIAHGLWTLGRALGEIGRSGTAPVKLEAAFKRPLFLPGRVLCWTRAEGVTTHFGVRDEASGVPHLVGQLNPV